VLKNFSFRSKLLLILFVPFLALVVIASAGLNDRFDDLRAQEQYGSLEQPLDALHGLSRALQREAVLNQWYVNAGRDGSIPIANARAATDDAVTQFRALEPRLRSADIGEAGAGLLNNVDSGIAQLAKERARVERQGIDAVTPPLLLLTLDDYLLDFGQTLARRLDDPSIAVAATGVFALEHEQTELAREASAILPLLANGDESSFTAWVRALAAEGRDRQQFQSTASEDDLAAFQNAITADLVSSDLLRPSNVSASLPTAFPDPSRRVTPAGYFDAYERQAKQLDQAVAAVNESVARRSAASSASARDEVWIYGGLAVFAMLLTIALMWLVARAVIRPLRNLADGAREISQVQLPQLVEQLRVGGDVSDAPLTHIAVSSHDEIGELAQAFEDVQAVTVEVAREQSRLLRKGMGDLFVNLARRNQSLLERQLELLDDLERNEHDPAALDALFKLDHMATRMRRNAESLLVLSGAEQPRQWQQPIALLDVVRAAAAEIADFPRVELVGIADDLAVSGRAVADVAHLLAELLENATSFSPPDTAVVVSGAPTSTGFVLAVSDQGIGIPPERVREANELLARPPAVGLALSRALGLHVVASLAARHRIGVELRAGAPIGMVALVTLPADVLELTGTPIAPAAPAVPVFAPDLDDEGAPTPLGARRMAWRPPDEPPVEEWRREGGDLPSMHDSPSGVQPESRPAPHLQPERDWRAAPTAAAPTARPTTPTAETPRSEPPHMDAPSREVPRSEQRVDEALGSSGPFDHPSDEAELDDDAPLPIRVPGRNLSHAPIAGTATPAPESDPMRPYRVHEFLSRHDQGKRRGRADADVFDPSVFTTDDPAPEGDR
jgi:signal transduction histidine kinase